MLKLESFPTVNIWSLHKTVDAFGILAPVAAIFVTFKNGGSVAHLLAGFLTQSFLCTNFLRLELAATNISFITFCEFFSKVLYLGIREFASSDL